MTPFPWRLELLIALLATVVSTTAIAADVQPDDLTAKAVALIDRAADDCPAESLWRRHTDFGGDFPGWIISRIPLPAAEECQRAAAMHRDLLSRVGVVPTPVAVDELLKRLVRELPPYQKPEEFEYVLTVIDEPKIDTFALGGGYIYITGPLLSKLLDAGDRGRDMLAFFLAHELAHVALRHSRSGIQLQIIRDEPAIQLESEASREHLEQALETAIQPGGALSRFLYTHRQEYAADLYALHLCRNCGISSEGALDALRYLCLLTGPQFRAVAGNAATPLEQPAAGDYFQSHPDALCRLQRLRRELSGRCERVGLYGLYVFDSAKGTFSPAASASLGAQDRAVVFVHGMEGNTGTYRTLMNRFADEEGAAGVQLLEFRYPNDNSLACSGELLTAEMRRVGASGGRVDFVCHSAGGLVFRYFAEVRQGGFREAIFQGTPHGGSDLVRLRSLLELTQFVRHLKLGYPAALEQALLDGTGQITIDLHPDSLFLRYLNRHDRQVSRYHVMRGRVLSSAKAALLDATLAASRRTLAPLVRHGIRSSRLQEMAQAWLERLVLPAEIQDGDLAVSVEKATLPGVEDVLTVRADHLTLKSDPAVIRAVLAILLKSP